jgi:hypothetical protein
LWASSRQKQIGTGSAKFGRRSAEGAGTFQLFRLGKSAIFGIFGRPEFGKDRQEGSAEFPVKIS